MEIVFEGIDGSGKSVLSTKLAQLLKSNQKQVQYIDNNSRFLRDIIVNSDKFISKELFFLLGLTDYKLIEEKLIDNKNEFVVFDRSFISILAYAAALGFNVDFDYMRVFKLPDIIFFIDAIGNEVVNSKNTISKGEVGGEIINKENFIKFQDKVYLNYKSLLKDLSNLTRVVYIDRQNGTEWAMTLIMKTIHFNNCTTD